jgi:hypothetical protein
LVIAVIYRAGLPERPSRIVALPLDRRGYPVPFFVGLGLDGQPDFRLGDARKLNRAIREGLCWICGQKLGRFLCVPVGPMCTVNRISAEAPCHRDCSEYALRTCPFILYPNASRREGNLPDDVEHSGHMIPDNPGVMALWITKSCAPFRPPGGGVLFRLGDPEEVTWWKQGRPATRAEVEEAFELGLEQRLKPLCEEPSQVEDVERRAAAARRWGPAAEEGATAP